jgi:hypothetical protein
MVKVLDIPRYPLPDSFVETIGHQTNTDTCEPIELGGKGSEAFCDSGDRGRCERAGNVGAPTFQVKLEGWTGPPPAVFRISDTNDWTCRRVAQVWE